MPSARPKVTPVQWFAVLTAVLAGGGLFTELGRGRPAWSVFIQSAIGVTAAFLAYRHRRWGGRLGIAWGAAQAIVVAVDGSGWIGRQFLVTYLGSRETDIGATTGTVVALNAIGGFFAFVWAWFLMRERWAD